MNKISLKNAMENSLENINLSDEQYHKLNALQLDSNHSASRRKPWYTAVATIMAVCISVASYIAYQQNSMSEKIAYEVSKNHLKLKPLEVHSEQLSVLSDYLSLLDFKLVNTSILSGADWELLGARYCSIQGNTAAQLRFKNKQTGTVETLYQAPYNADQFSDLPSLENNKHPITEFSKGMGVTIWIEKGVLFALTDNTHQPQ